MAPELLEWSATSPSPEATERFGEALGRCLRAGDVVGLDGEMGSGKTTLVRGLARGLDVEDDVTSPSFVLMQEYAGAVPLFHFDAWMSGRESLFLQAGGAEYLGGEGVAVVEWADRVAAFLPRPHLHLRLAHTSQVSRHLTLRIVGDGQELLQRLGPAIEGDPFS